MSDWERFKKSGDKCWFCWLGWQECENGHIEPNNLGWVECDDKASQSDANEKPCASG